MAEVFLANHGLFHAIAQRYRDSAEDVAAKARLSA
jgi:hypothetical protein